MNRGTAKTILFLVAIVVLIGSLFYTVNYGYQQGVQSTQAEIQDQNNQINHYTRPQLLIITTSSIGYNLTGIVFNEGFSTAHNARVSVGYGYAIINLGDIGSQTSVSFNQYIPPPQGQVYPMYHIEALWNEKTPDQY